MIDLDRELRALDEIPAPDLGRGWRVPREPHDDRSPFARDGSTRVSVIATVTVICLVAGGLVWRAFTPGDDAPATMPTPAPAPGDPLANIPEGWSDLPAPPTTAEVVTTVWAGDRFIVWGGIDPEKEPDDGGRVLVEGWSFDPTSMRWTPIAPAPIARYGATAFWTGSEVLVWGGHDDADVRMDGAAFEPSSDTWRMIDAAPIAPRDPAVVIWNGTELLVWGGGDVDAPHLDGSAYDPGLDEWRVLPDAPLGMNLADAVWTGRDVVIVGSLLDGRNHATTRSAQAIAYDPTSDAWRRLPAPGLSPQSSAVAAVGTSVYAFDYVHEAALLDSRNDVWSRLADLPIHPSECYVEAESISPVEFHHAAVFGWSCGDAALFDVSDGLWDVIAERQDPMDYVTAEPIGAGGVVFLFGYGVTAYEGEVCIGCDGSPVVFRAYRPAADVGVTATGDDPEQDASSETAGRDILASGVDVFAGKWRLFVEETAIGPVVGVLLPDAQTFTSELRPTEARSFGNSHLAWASDGTVVLVQVVAPSVERVEVHLDDGNVVQATVADVPNTLLDDPARIAVVGIPAEVTVEGQRFDPDGVVVAYGSDGQELDRRRLSTA